MAPSTKKDKTPKKPQRAADGAATPDDAQAKELSPRARKRADRRAAAAAAKASGANPRWFVPLMVGLMLVGLVWVVVYYLTQARFPVQAWGNWNLAAGFGLIIAGFLMTTRWR